MQTEAREEAKFVWFWHHPRGINADETRNLCSVSKDPSYTQAMLIWALGQFRDNGFIHLVIWKKAERVWQLQKTSVVIIKDWERLLPSRFWLNHCDSVNLQVLGPKNIVIRKSLLCRSQILLFWKSDGHTESCSFGLIEDPLPALLLTLHKCTKGPVSSWIFNFLKPLGHLDIFQKQEF